MNKNRCNWCEKDPLYIDYHDNEWGEPLYDDQQLFELLILEGMQAGLSWITILKKRENFRKAFNDFNPEKIARYNQKKIESLMQNTGIIRNRLKINSVITNAKLYCDIQAKDNFSDYIWQFVDGEPIQNRWHSLKQIPASTEVSDQMLKTLKKVGFKFIGSTICYAFMQATGMVNDHVISCYRHKELSAQRKLTTT